MKENGSAVVLDIDMSVQDGTSSYLFIYKQIARPTLIFTVNWTVGKRLHELHYDYKNKPILFEIYSEYFTQSGLLCDSDKLVLFCRPRFHEQFHFLHEIVLRKARLGWILGPPGTGKSMATLAFASSLPKSEWTITWFHLNRDQSTTCVRLDHESRRTCSFVDIVNLKAILSQVNITKKHIVFVDGYVSDFQHHNDVKRLVLCSRCTG